MRSNLSRTGLPATMRYGRREMVAGLGLSAFFFTTPGAFAEQLSLTPKQTEGPFYPDKLPLDTDNDLIIINNGLTPAVGEVAWVHGRILNSRGTPLSNATVEIWQCDANGAYLHSKTGNADKRDSNFQGFGRFVTGSSGEYQFRTIKPVPYANRTAHIHFAVKPRGQEKLVTQCYIKGHPLNEKDGVLRRMSDEKEKALLMVTFERMPNSKAGELHTKFDIVLPTAS